VLSAFLLTILFTQIYKAFLGWEKTTISTRGTLDTKFLRDCGKYLLFHNEQLCIDHG
jgi:hypothetical protein